MLQLIKSTKEEILNNGEDLETIYQGENTQSYYNGFYIIKEINPTKEYIMYIMVIEKINACRHSSHMHI